MQRIDAMNVKLTELTAIVRKALWLGAWTIHIANRLRAKADGMKVAGHQVSCASMVTLMTVLCGAVLRPQCAGQVRQPAGGTGPDPLARIDRDAIVAARGALAPGRPLPLEQGGT